MSITDYFYHEVVFCASTIVTEKF